ncbi:hypothetical protein Mapa_004816 [Marchantia paleacea]|nr:hypothetical protein Mapa_004816 [Marchantia paleacea]
MQLEAAPIRQQQQRPGHGFGAGSDFEAYLEPGEKCSGQGGALAIFAAHSEAEVRDVLDRLGAQPAELVLALRFEDGGHEEGAVVARRHLVAQVEVLHQVLQRLQVQPRVTLLLERGQKILLQQLLEVLPDQKPVLRAGDPPPGRLLEILPDADQPAQKHIGQPVGIDHHEIALGEVDHRPHVVQVRGHGSQHSLPLLLLQIMPQIPQIRVRLLAQHGEFLKGNDRLQLVGRGPIDEEIAHLAAGVGHSEELLFEELLEAAVDVVDDGLRVLLAAAIDVEENGRDVHHVLEFLAQLEKDALGPFGLGSADLVFVSEHDHHAGQVEPRHLGVGGDEAQPRQELLAERLLELRLHGLALAVEEREDEEKDAGAVQLGEEVLLQRSEDVLPRQVPDRDLHGPVVAQHVDVDALRPRHELVLQLLHHRLLLRHLQHAMPQPRLSCHHQHTATRFSFRFPDIPITEIVCGQNSYTHEVEVRQESIFSNSSNISLDPSELGVILPELVLLPPYIWTVFSRAGKFDRAARQMNAWKENALAKESGPGPGSGFSG